MQVIKKVSFVLTCCFLCGFRFLTNDDEVICDWEIRAKESHYASISFDVFQLSEQSRSKHGDCLSIYDGEN